MSHVTSESRPLPDRPTSVALAGTVLVQDLSSLSEGDPFRDGLFVGNLLFSGGYVTESQEVGQQNVSKDIDEEAVATYRAQVVDWLDGAMGEALDKQRVRWQRVSLDTTQLKAPTRRDRRGTHEDDGRDDVNLPRFELEPVPLSAEALGEVPAGVDAVIVPFVVLYYSHNAGWFVGQTYGTGAGARFRVLAAAYTPDGAPLGHTDITARFLHEELFQPNSGELQDFVITTESLMQRELGKRLLR